jgi:hypothetical protein
MVRLLEKVSNMFYFICGLLVGMTFLLVMFSIFVVPKIEDIKDDLKKLQMELFRAEQKNKTLYPHVKD